MNSFTQLVEKASRPGVLGLPGKVLEKRCQRDLRAYFETLKGQVLALGLGELVNQPAPHADMELRLKVGRLLRVSSPALKGILEVNLTRAFQVAAGQALVVESDDEMRDDHGRWTSGGGTSSTKGETPALKSKALSAAGLAAVAVLAVSGLSGAKTLIGTPYSVMSCSQFACALTGRKHEWADKLYEEGKPGKVSDAKDGDIVAFNGSHVAVMTKDGLMDSIPERGVGFADLSKVSPADPWYKGPVRIIKGKPLGNVKESDQPSTKPLDELGVTGLDAVKYAEQRAGELIAGLNQTTIEEIANTIAEGIEERLGVDGTSRLLRDLLDGMTKDRADLIATTEINGAMSEATLRKIKGLEIPYKRWIIADDDADEECAGNEDDGPIPVDEAFSSGDYRPPAHPNCRCAVVGARAPEETL